MDEIQINMSNDSIKAKEDIEKLKVTKGEGGYDKGDYLGDSRFLTAVFGGLSALNTIEDATTWVKTEIGKLRLELAIDTFVKNTEVIFKGLCFREVFFTRSTRQCCRRI